MMDHLQAWTLRGLLWCLGCLPPIWASRLGGGIARHLGPALPLSHIAEVNLRHAFPGMSVQERRRVIRGCWENLGRTLAELPHLPRLPSRQDRQHQPGPGWHVLNAHILDDARKTGRPVIFFSGHLGNWELMPLILARYGLAFSPFYRAPNNQQVDRLLCQLRRRIAGEAISFFPKGQQGARNAVRHLARGGHLGVLGDQKMNDGIEISFFGHPTMTAPAAAGLALRFDALIITGRVWRKGPARLVLEVASCLDPKQMPLHSLSRQEAIQNLTQMLNNTLEKWITERPADWLWLHRRWDKKLYQRQKK